MVVQMLVLAVTTLIKFFIYALLARGWMIAFRLSFRHPLGEFIRTCTGWLTRPFEGRSLNHRRFVIIPVVLSWVVLFLLTLATLMTLTIGKGPASDTDFLITAAEIATTELLVMGLTMLIAAMIIQAILSWVNPHAPVMGFLLSFTAPLLAPFRRIIPSVSGIDFSPMAAIFVCYLLISLLKNWHSSTPLFF